MIRIPLFALLFAVTAVWAVAQDPTAGHDQHEDHDNHDDHVAEAAGIRAIHGWTNATTGGSALVFVDIENRSDAVMTLLGAETDIAAGVELVALENVGGELRYTTIPQMPVAPGVKVVLAPNGLALRLDGLFGSLDEGGHFTVDLLLDDATLSVTIEIESADAMQHSHAGHSH